MERWSTFKIGPKTQITFSPFGSIEFHWLSA